MKLYVLSQQGHYRSQVQDHKFVNMKVTGMCQIPGIHTVTYTDQKLQARSIFVDRDTNRQTIIWTDLRQYSSNQFIESGRVSIIKNVNHVGK